LRDLVAEGKVVVEIVLPVKARRRLRRSFDRSGRPYRLFDTPLI